MKPTIKDAERVYHLATDRSLLQRVDVTDLEVAIGDLRWGKFEIKHLGAELLDVLRRERDAQIAAIEAEIRTLGFTLDDIPPVEPPPLHAVQPDVW